MATAGSSTRSRPRRRSSQYVQPAFATEIRARLGAKLAEILPGDMDKVFFTLGGAEAIENAIKLARARDRAAQDPRPLPLVPRGDARAR